MRQNLKFIVLLTLLMAFFITGCELSRPDEKGADISDTSPEITTPAAVVLPATEPAAQPVDIESAVRTAPAPPAADKVEPGKVLVKLYPQAAIQTQRLQEPDSDAVSTGISSLDERLEQIGTTNIEPVAADVAKVTGKTTGQITIQVEQVGQLFFVAYDSGADPTQVSELLEEDPAVEYSEPNFIAGVAGAPQPVPALFDPDDPYYRYQWHFSNIQMPSAWNISTGQDIVVAVVDTGTDFNASDLANTQHLPGYDFVNNDSDPTDDNSHGSHVSGTIAQSTNNNLGVAGMAFNARLLPVKVLAADGNGSYENIIKGIIYAVDQGAKIINMSLAGTSPSSGLLDAVKYAHSKGVILVAAAGNSNSSVAYPAAYDEYVIGVGAVRLDNTRARYSNFGPEIDLVAPGGDVQVDQNGDGYADGVLQQTLKSGGGYSYQFFEGTSMASPHVAGLAALLLAGKPDASPAEIENVMAQTAVKNLGTPNEYGAGLIQAADALAAIVATPVTPTFTPVPSSPIPTPTSTFTPLPSPSSTTFPTCTPPPCDNGIYVCPSGNCPGGCGVVCAPSTPTPAPPSPTSTFTPSPSPTFTPSVTPVPPSPTSTVMPSPSPTPTFTPPTPPLPAGELLQNGDFETDQGWIFGDTPVRGSYSTEVVLNGNRAGKTGITNGPDRYSFTSMWQQVIIPNDAQQVTLTAHTYPLSLDRPGTDVQNIFILNNRFRIIKQLSRKLSNSQSWEAHTYNLSDLRGQTIYVYFGVYNNGYGHKPTAIYIDNVSLRWVR